MSKLTPKELDKLFQQGSKQHDFEYNPHAWKDMEDKLDESDRRRRVILWWFFGLPAFALLFGVLYFTQRNSPLKYESALTSEIANINGHDFDTYEEPKIIDEEIIVKDAIDRTFDEVVKLEEKVSKKGSKTNTASKGGEALAITGRKEAGHSKQVKRVEMMSFLTSKNNKKTLNTKKAMVEEFDNEQIEISSLSLLLERNKLGVTLQLPLLSLTPLSVPNELVLVEVNTESSLMDSDEERKRNEKRNVFLIGAVVGAEMSMANRDLLSNLNYRVGLNLEYQILKSFSINIAAIYDRKTYEAGVGEYSPPKGFWTRKIAPKSTVAECNILEIPLSISYYPMGYTKSGFVGGIGVSSFLMLNEEYLYFYDVPDLDLRKRWGTKNENKHWFGIGELSLGYNYLISSEFSVYATPYFQIPMAGVGHGQVKLWSGGINFGIKYRL